MQDTSMRKAALTILAWIDRFGWIVSGCITVGTWLWGYLMEWGPAAVVIAFLAGTFALVFMMAVKQALYEHRKRLDEASRKGKPCPELYLFNELRETYLEIINHNVDAVFSAQIDLKDSHVYGHPFVPMPVVWYSQSNAESRKILAESRDRILVFNTDVETRAFLMTNIFAYIAFGNPRELRSNSWILTSDHGGSIPPAGKIKVVISSDPQMVGGAKVIEIGYEAEKAWIISGDAKLKNEW